MNRKEKKEKKLRDAVRTAKFEIVRAISEDGEHYKRWDAMVEAMQEAKNLAHQLWLNWHLEHGTADRVRAANETWKAWHNEPEATRGPRPERDGIEAVPPELRKLIEKALQARFPEVHTRTWTVFMQSWQLDLSTRKSAKGSLPGWKSVLLCRQAIPSFTRRQPIPFDSGNCPGKEIASYLVAPDEALNEYRLRVRFTRLPVPGKQKADSLLDEIVLKTKHRKAAGQLAILKRLLSGEYKFCGSNLVWDERNRKWFVHLCFKMPVPERQVGDGFAVLRPGRRSCWRLLIGNRVLDRFGGPGNDVAYQRHNITSQRRSRQEYYRKCQPATGKGHGRKRAEKHWQHLQQLWVNFCTTRNHLTTKEVVSLCLRFGVGTLTYIQPEGRFGESRRLASAGKSEELRENSSWTWHQVATQLGYKCKDAGVHLIVKKRGWGRERSDEEGSESGSKRAVLAKARRRLSGARS